MTWDGIFESAIGGGLGALGAGGILLWRQWHLQRKQVLVAAQTQIFIEFGKTGLKAQNILTNGAGLRESQAMGNAPLESGKDILFAVANYKDDLFAYNEPFYRLFEKDVSVYDEHLKFVDLYEELKGRVIANPNFVDPVFKNQFSDDLQKLLVIYHEIQFRISTIVIKGRRASESELEKLKKEQEELQRTGRRMAS